PLVFHPAAGIPAERVSRGLGEVDKRQACSHLLDERFTWGGVELHFDVEKGVITRAQVFTDSLNPAPLEALAERLQGCLYRADTLQDTGEALLATSPEQERELRELASWVAGAVR
ncbi:hypothetical protein C9F07_06300, partial [Salmonella enterica subsp. enterica serovar Poona]